MFIPLVLINSNRKYWMVINEMIVIDLPKLRSIQLGQSALEGRESDESCSLIMRGMNEIE